MTRFFIQIKDKQTLYRIYTERMNFGEAKPLSTATTLQAEFGKTGI